MITAYQGIVISLLAIIAFVALFFFLVYMVASEKVSEFLSNDKSEPGIDQQGWLQCVQGSKTVAECDQEFLH